MDYVREDGEMFEVLHIECDFNDFNEFRDKLYEFEYRINRMDFEDSARRIWRARDEWRHLKGFTQNDWKAKYLLGWDKSEYTEKAI